MFALSWSTLNCWTVASAKLPYPGQSFPVKISTGHLNSEKKNLTHRHENKWRCVLCMVLSYCKFKWFELAVKKQFAYLCISSLSPLNLSTSNFDIFQGAYLFPLTVVTVTWSEHFIKSFYEIFFSLLLYRRIWAVPDKVLPLHAFACSTWNILLWKIK